VPSQGPEFISQVEHLMDRTIGRLVGRSIVKNQLKKLQKDPFIFTADDGSTFIQHTVTALSIFVTQQEVNAAQTELYRLHRAHF
jgi:hypothetical protein